MKDFSEFIAGPLKLPIGGKLYTIPPVDITTGLLLRRALDPSDTEAVERLLLGDDEHKGRRRNGAAADDRVMLAGYRRVLGSALDEMLADGVAWDAMDRAYLTAVTDHQRGRVIAEQVWELGYDPKALMATVQAGARLAKSGAASERSIPRQDNSRRTTISPGAKRKRKRRGAARSTGR